MGGAANASATTNLSLGCFDLFPGERSLGRKDGDRTAFFEWIPRFLYGRCGRGCGNGGAIGSRCGIGIGGGIGRTMVMRVDFNSDVRVGDRTFGVNKSRRGGNLTIR